MQQKRPHLNPLILALALAAVLMIWSVFTTSNTPSGTTMSYSTVVHYFEHLQVTAFTLDRNTGVITMNIKEGDLPLPEGAIAESRVAEEYGRFQALVEEKRLMALLRIGRECMPFDTASHIIGVHNVALHAAILARAAGLPVDLPLVSAASLSHDVGKFGCRGADLKRIAYLHYYFTWTWLEEAGLPEIGHVAANHSTWDLEFENLPMESLLLIYADFRVRGHRENGREIMGIYSLAESRDMIFSQRMCFPSGGRKTLPPAGI